MARLVTNLKSIMEQVKGAGEAALLQTGADIYDISQQLVPVKTGRLKRSGGVVPESSTKVVVGYGNEEVTWAEAVEFGTTNSAAQPYLLPACSQAEETFKKRLEEQLKGVK